MAVLIYKDSGGRYVDFQLPHRTITIGRSEVADVAIHDDWISRLHCEISRRAGEFIIRDLDSRNGTFVNESRVKETTLRVGDKIRVGHTLIAFDS